MNEENGKEAFLVTADNDLEAGMIESLLKAYGIPVLRKYGQLQRHMKIIAGMSHSSVDIYVLSELLDKAKEILDNK